MRILIRRPHAYAFRRKYRRAPIPGITVLDGDGKFTGGVRLPSRRAVERIVDLLAK